MAGLIARDVTAVVLGPYGISFQLAVFLVRSYSTSYSLQLVAR